MKSAIQIEDDVFGYLKTTSLKTSINGVIRNGRPIPPDSTKEDVWIKCLAVESGQIQEAIVIVNVYIPDAYDKTEGQYIIDRKRVRTLASLCNTLLEYKSIRDYHFELQTQTIEKIQEANKHYITNRLLYRHNTNT